MIGPGLGKPLDEAELDALDYFLLTRGRDEHYGEDQADDYDFGILNLAELDGFLTGIVSAPTVILPSLWLEYVWGEESPAFKDEQEAMFWIGQIMRHMNRIAGMLIAQPDDFEPMFPVYETPEGDEEQVGDWCWGYVSATKLWPPGWDADDAALTAFMPIHCHGTPDGLEFLENQVPADERAAMRAALPDAIRQMHAHHLASKTPRPVQAEPQAGRNDPCPCGSGKKYKKCCLH